jgi:metal-responsive CopG/Arc/MetJ family transcriptional regulator
MEQLGSDNQMIHMRFDQPLLERLDDFRFKHRFESRSEAARWLINAALKAKFAPEDKTQKRKGTK